MPQVRSDARLVGCVGVPGTRCSCQPFSGTAIPGDHPFQEGDDIMGEDAKEGLALLSGRATRVADVAGLRSVPW